MENKLDRISLFWSSNDDSWHTQETIAAVTELSLNTLANWRAQGNGPAYSKSGKLIYYRKKDVVAWFNSIPTSKTQAA